MTKLVFDTPINGVLCTVHVNDTPKDFEVELFTPTGEKADIEITPPIYKQVLEEAFYASFATQRGIEY